MKTTSAGDQIKKLNRSIRNHRLDDAQQTLINLDPFQARNVIESLPARDALVAFRLLDRRTMLAVFELLPHDSQSELLRTMQDEEAVRVLETLEPDEAAQLLEEMPSAVVERLVAQMRPESRKAVNAILAYPEGSAGRRMNVHALVLPPDMTVAAAMERVRESTLQADEMQVVFVADAARVFHGYVPIADVLRAASHLTLGSLAGKGGMVIRTTDPAMQAARMIRNSGLSALAVVDRENHLVGAVSAADLAEVSEMEASETMYQKAGLRDVAKRKDHVFSRKLTQGGILYPVRVRILFLFVTLLGGLAVGGLIDAFEETLAAILAAAVFIPLVMDMGGNVGTQSTTIFARGFALGHIKLSQFWRYFLREGTIGLTMGLLLGTLAGIIAYFWQGVPNGIPQLGFAVGISLATVITLAAMLGFLLPYLMVKMGLDHAPGADPFITTIKDFTGLALYFYLVSLLIGTPGPGDEAARLDLTRPPSVVASAVVE